MWSLWMYCDRNLKDNPGCAEKAKQRRLWELQSLCWDFCSQPTNLQVNVFRRVSPNIAKVFSGWWYFWAFSLLSIWFLVCDHFKRTIQNKNVKSWLTFFWEVWRKCGGVFSFQREANKWNKNKRKGGTIYQFSTFTSMEARSRIQNVQNAFAWSRKLES